MGFGPALAVAATALLAVWEPAMLLVALPFCALWLVSPLVAWWLSRTLPAVPVHLSDSQRVFLRKLARRTWRYFEVFVTADENWLPPDNYQERLADGIASRTSPTNIGVALLADLAACDFGYYRETFYHITIRNGGNGLTVTRVVADGNEQPEKFVPLIDDRNDHNVEVDVG